jgi:hypothetical protein
MNHTRNAAFMLLAALIAASVIIAIPVARAAEPTLEVILDSLHFSPRTLVGATPFGSTETFPAGTYNITMYAEYAGYRDQNQLGWYAVGTNGFNQIFSGPEGVPHGTPEPGGLVPSPLTTATKSFISSTTFGLSLVAPDGTFYTETSKNPDVPAARAHAEIYQSQTNLNLFWIGFENMGVQQGSDFDYNDMVVSLELTYYLTVNNGGHGTASGQDWYVAGTSGPFSITPTTVSGGTGVQYVFTGWSSSDTGGYTGPLSSYSVTMNNPITETANWQTQYYLTVNNGGHGTASGQGWYGDGITAYAGLLSGTVPDGAGKQHVFTTWSGDASGTNYAQSNPITMDRAKEAIANWKTQWYITVDSAHDTPTASAWVDDSSDFTASVTSPEFDGSGHRWDCTGYKIDGGALTSGTSYTFTHVTAPHTIEFFWTARVGGEWFPATTLPTLAPSNVLQLLAPWIVLAFVAASVFAAYRKLFKKRW